METRESIELKESIEENKRLKQCLREVEEALYDPRTPITNALIIIDEYRSSTKS